MLENRNPGASVLGLDFNRHGRGHLLRAAQEGVVFALKYGLDIMGEVGIPVETVRAGNANMFLSSLFSEAFATIADARVELYSTDGSQGAARGAGIGAGIYDCQNAFVGLENMSVVEPKAAVSEAYRNAYDLWVRRLKGE
jgi:xylulokinase